MRWQLIGIIMMGFWLTSTAFGQSAREVMKRSNELDLGKTSKATTTMTLFEPGDTQGKVRKMVVLKRSFPSDTKSVTFFVAPKSLAKTGYLNIDYNNPAKDDTSFLYMRKSRVRQILGADQSQPFMDSDFTYADINGLELDDWDYRFAKKNEKVGGHDCWVIEAEPVRNKARAVKEKTGYRKTMVWVRKDNYVPVQAKYYSSTSNHVKFMSVPVVRKIQGVWTPMVTQMVTTLKGKKEIHRTTNKILDIKYNVPIDKNTFTTKTLQTGI